MVDSSELDLFPTEEATRRIIDAVGIEIPASQRHTDWLADFQNDLSEVLKAGWYATLGMVDPDAEDERSRLRHALAEEDGSEATGRGQSRLPDSHIRELVERAGWLYDRWWDRPFAASRTHETEHTEPRGGGPAVRIVQAIATELLEMIEVDTLPSSWPRLSSEDSIQKIAEQLRGLAKGSETARNRIRKSSPYGVLRRLESHLSHKSISMVELAYDERGHLVPSSLTDADRDTVLNKIRAEFRRREDNF
jgi:hypothetical protein